MEDYGGAGLRTLCLAYRKLSLTEYQRWSDLYGEASRALQQRQTRMDEVSELIEKDLILLGCTAIEDKLQNGVPETLQKLSNAGIRLWILTGDKKETAINIGYACNLLSDTMTQFIMQGDTNQTCLLEDEGRYAEAEALMASNIRQQLFDVLANIPNYDFTQKALIIDGKALRFALDASNKNQLAQIGEQCSTVICCRVSPKQKAQVTSMVKAGKRITLAIGDGANDVGMIQAAHIGVGISGNEGMQAVMAADFAIAQFKYLQSLLLIHGRWSYKRITRMINYFFYKNLYFGLTLFFYNFFCFFSGQVIYHDFYMTCFNVMFTSIPPLVIGAMDFDLRKHTVFKHPQLYEESQTNAGFQVHVIVMWFIRATWQALFTTVAVIWAVAVYSDRSSGQTPEHLHAGLLMFSVVVHTVHYQLAVLVDNWTWLHHFSIWGSIIFWYLFVIIYSTMPPFISSSQWNLFLGVVAPSPSFWLTILIVPVALVLPDLIGILSQRWLFPKDFQILQEQAKQQQQKEKSVHMKRITLEPHKYRNSINRGFVPIYDDERKINIASNNPVVNRSLSNRRSLEQSMLSNITAPSLDTIQESDQQTIVEYFT